ncbi:L-lactate permease [Pelosinus sp. sgz500959]|uniref:L-lactate permease n=1 Tax=Pelosinus sp. sgz500959 TaxID=3242472 RepID=UPI00366F80D9
MWQIIVSPYGVLASSLVGFIPLFWLLISLGWLKIAAPKACFIGLIITITLAMFSWNMPGALTLRAGLEGSVYAFFPIIWVIIAALFTYNLSVKTGAMDNIKHQIANLSTDRRIQALLIVWGFGGFLEAMAGFGTAVAIPAAILIGLGFDPFFAAAFCLISNTAPTAFGAIGIPVTTLSGVANVPLLPLTFDVALQLTPLVILIPFILVIIMTKKLSGLKGVIGATLIAGGSFAAVQLLVAKYLGPQLTAVLGSVTSMVLTTIWVKLFPPKTVWKFPSEQDVTTETSVEGSTESVGRLTAWLPYILLLVLILGTSSLVPILNEPLNTLMSIYNIYTGPGGHQLEVNWFITPGTLIMIAAIIGGRIQGASFAEMSTTLFKTIALLPKTIVTVICIISMAKIMGYSGMVSAIALGLANATGNSYPAIAPAIGALGTFVTGSDTSSNILFGALQKQTAIEIGANSTWITASNMAGATAGKMISPQSIAIAASSTGLTGREGDLMGVTFKYCILFCIILGTLVFVNA